MTTLLEPPTVFAQGKPPGAFEGDAPAPPAESAEREPDEESLEDQEEI
ncbi:MAG: hypothetical protein M3N49_14965 [Candidatus Eremiobacteraeota bacterium]|nr:hypothetical protein [Candidatus Eremiobacteraeota bacterium]